MARSKKQDPMYGPSIPPIDLTSVEDKPALTHLDQSKAQRKRGEKSIRKMNRPGEGMDFQSRNLHFNVARLAERKVMGERSYLDEMGRPVAVPSAKHFVSTYGASANELVRRYKEHGSVLLPIDVKKMR